MSPESDSLAMRVSARSPPHLGRQAKHAGYKRCQFCRVPSSTTCANSIKPVSRARPRRMRGSIPTQRLAEFRLLAHSLSSREGSVESLNTALLVQIRVCVRQPLSASVQSARLTARFAAIEIRGLPRRPVEKGRFGFGIGIAVPSRTACAGCSW
jgi:hypothetical protein